MLANIESTRRIILALLLISKMSECSSEHDGLFGMLVTVHLITAPDCSRCSSYGLTTFQELNVN